jgi:hypothetical protein
MVHSYIVPTPLTNLPPYKYQAFTLARADVSWELFLRSGSAEYYDV